jgi:hypothetical protein
VVKAPRAPRSRSRKETFAEMSAVVPADNFGGVVDRFLEWHQRAARGRLATHYVFPKQAHNLRSMVARIGVTGSAAANCCAGSAAMRPIATIELRDVSTYWAAHMCSAVVGVFDRFAFTGEG